MKQFRSSRAIMIELMIIVLFFSLSSVIIVRLFAAADQLSIHCTASAKLLQTGQSWADRLQAEEDIPGYLLANGWTQDENGLSLSVDGGILSVSGIKAEEGANGWLDSCELTAFTDQQEIFTLPIARYRSEAQP